MGRPTLAVWKFASCDGCQLTLLDCEDELLALAGQIEIVHFLEAGASGAGPYDVCVTAELISACACDPTGGPAGPSSSASGMNCSG